MEKPWWERLPGPTLIETAWERQMNLTGMEAYEASRINPRTQKAADPSTTAAGQKVTRRLLKTIEEAITGLQKSLTEAGHNGRRALHPRATILSVPADTIALLTLRPLIDKTYTASNPDMGAAYQSVAVDLAKAVELELNFRHWVASSREAAAAYAAEKELTKVPKSSADRMLEDSGMGRQAKVRWRRAIAEVAQYEWTTEELHFCGDAILKTVCSALPDHFEVHHFLARGRNQKFVKMTDTFRKEFDDMEYHIASMQMVRKPMITKPRRWIASGG